VQTCRRLTYLLTTTADGSGQNEIAGAEIFAVCHDFGQMPRFRNAAANLGDLSKNNILKLLNTLIN